MEVKSVYKYARTSAQKVREVTREVQGMSVSHALSILNYTPKKAALLIGKTLQSAVANAEHNHQLDAEDLFVKSAIATDGPALKRIMPRARGSAAAIKKKTCHITIILAAKVEAKPAAPEAAEESSATGTKKKAAKKSPAPAEGEAKAKRARKAKVSE